jgi:hypothetical protein
MKLFSSKRRMAVVGLTVGLIAGASGLAVAYFTSAGSGIGQAQVGTASPILINQIGGTPLYNSRLTNATDYQASLCFYCISNYELGQRVTLAGGGGAFNDVTVDMANFGGTAGSTNMTFTVYAAGTGNTPGATLGSVTQDVAFPAGPDGGYGSPYCTTGGGSSDPACGIANFTTTFNFSSQSLTLPSTVVWGLTFDDPQNSVNGGVNIQLSDDTAGQPSIGSETDANSMFADTNGAGNGDTGGATGEVTCSAIVPGFTEYSTVATTACGLQPYIPAVEFNSPGSDDLYPGGPAQVINYSLTNPGSASASVNQVTISVATDPSGPNAGDVETNPGDATSAVAGCLASWFTINGSPVTIGTTINPGQTVNEINTANIQMSNPNVDQDACQGITVGLNFSSD